MTTDEFEPNNLCHHCKSAEFGVLKLLGTGTRSERDGRRGPGLNRTGPRSEWDWQQLGPLTSRKISTMISPMFVKVLSAKSFNRKSLKVGTESSSQEDIFPF
uniref:Uncharacterized protein n=1 Tax=Cacopsylla melanoneura TaxID=428564 RepID=A0A8D9DX88_9HEMI